MDFETLSSPEVDDAVLLAELRVQVPGYRLNGILGRGGQATVYKAIDLSNGQLVAIKILHGGPFADAHARGRFEREITAIKALNHPNIVTHRANGQTPAGHSYLIMNFIEGRRLDEYLWRESNVESPALRAQLELFIKICRAVGEAHRLGIAHRDLSPSNIRVDESGEPHILDFGLARGTPDGHFSGGQDSITATREFVGKLSYASPEQIQGDRFPIELPSDVYSLGVILYQILAYGGFPYDVGGSMMEILENILRRNPHSLASTGSKTDRRDVLRQSAELVALRALQKKPEDRPHSANELALLLEHCLAGAPPSEKRRFWRRRLPMGAAAAALIAFTATIYWSHLPNATQYSTAAESTVPRSFTNSLGMKFVRIDAAEFTMGSSLPALKDEQMSPHIVKITAPFLMQTTLVTRGQFEAFVKSTAYVTDAERRGGLGAGDDDGLPPDPELSWKKPGIVQDLNHPVVGISWNDAVRFASWMHERDGQPYRLPTEAEWELACRGGYEGYLYPWGNNLETGRKYANLNWGKSHPVTTVPVGTLLPNNFGLYDMIGNAWQWCSDVMGIEVKDAVDPVGPAVQDPKAKHVIRGAGYASSSLYSRMDTRISMAANQANYASGFRLAMSKHIRPSPPNSPSTDSALVSPTSSQPTEIATPDIDASVWTTLVSDKGLDALHAIVPAQADDSATWEVKNGVLTGHGGPSASIGNGGEGEMRTTDQFQNLALHFASMLPEGSGGGGVRLVTPAGAEGQISETGQFRVTLGGPDPNRNPGSIWSNGRLMVRAKTPPLARGKWFNVDINHKDESVTVFINNTLVASFSDISLKGAHGCIGLMVDADGTVRFQDVRIRRLASTRS